MPTVKNPILKGFNPDPSICCVGDDYYIATSTFEYTGGVQIHHSKDLVNWELIAHPLSRKSQLNLEGNQASAGVWAPCLSYHDDQFWLIYTDVKKYLSPIHDHHNYLVTSPTIDGEWSEPLYLNGAGFDPSLFHDDDGKKWYVQMEWDYRAIPCMENEGDPAKYSGGIWLQEYDHKKQQLIGEKIRIFYQTELGYTEGPHIYKIDGYYYLMVAEAGTFYKHAVTVVRSKTLTGDYEIHPANPLLTSVNNPDLMLQKAGHASMCQSPDGNWYLAHLCGRPLTQLGKCVMGRETALQPLEWKDGWMYIKGGNNEPLDSFEVPITKETTPIQDPNLITDFDENKLNIHFSGLRIYPDDSWLSLSENPSHLRLYGQESPVSKFKQSAIFKRQQHFNFSSETSIKFQPTHYQQMAGLSYRYNEDNFYFLNVSCDDNKNKHLTLMLFMNGVMTLPLWNNEIPLQTDQEVHLKLEVRHDKAQFFYSFNQKEWLKIGSELASDVMSDDAVTPFGFTGAFTGISCHDISGQKLFADFDYFHYKVL